MILTPPPHPRASPRSSQKASSLMAIFGPSVKAGRPSRRRTRDMAVLRDFEPSASRSCPVHPLTWNAAQPPVSVQRSHTVARLTLLRLLGFVAPWEIVIQPCSADSNG